jgi:uncharacterized OB-fold protein
MERPAPPLIDRTAEFWTGGAAGELRIARCQACGHYTHPPKPVCPRCRTTDMRFEAVSGRGIVHSCTINRYEWVPGMTPPYVVADVELVEQAGLRLQTNVVGCEPEDVEIGMAVTVAFEPAGDTYIPVFRP